MSAINSSRNSLIEINDIRNRFAHRSKFAQVKFQQVVRNALGYVPRGINPGRFLLTPDPSNTNIRIIDKYVAIITVSARTIVQ